MFYDDKPLKMHTRCSMIETDGRNREQFPKDVGARRHKGLAQGAQNLKHDPPILGCQSKDILSAEIVTNFDDETPQRTLKKKN